MTVLDHMVMHLHASMNDEEKFQCEEFMVLHRIFDSSGEGLRNEFCKWQKAFEEDYTNMEIDIPFTIRFSTQLRDLSSYF